jgi:hypothetical protein
MGELAMPYRHALTASAVLTLLLTGATLSQTNAPTEFESARDRGRKALKKKDNETAEREFRKALQMEPNAGQVSYWLGVALMRHQDVSLYPEALFHISRAVVAEGPNELREPDKRTAENYLTRAYAGFHGSNEGLDRLKELARHNTFPPPGSKVLPEPPAIPATAVSIRSEEPTRTSGFGATFEKLFSDPPAANTLPWPKAASFRRLTSQ